MSPLTYDGFKQVKVLVFLMQSGNYRAKVTSSEGELGDKVW